MRPGRGDERNTQQRLSPSPACLRDRWGREKHSELRPEKPCPGTGGRGFDSRHLHDVALKPSACFDRVSPLPSTMMRSGRGSLAGTSRQC